MSANRIAHVTLYDLGVGTASLISALAGAARSVTIVEPDASDAERVDTILRRRLQGKIFAVVSDLAGPCDLFLCRACDAACAPKGAIIGLTDGPAGLEGVGDPLRSVALDLTDLGLVEIAFGAASEETCHAVTGLMKALNALYAVTRSVDAFAGTILQDAALAMIDHLLLRGQTPWEFDEALEVAGFAEGVLKAQDQIGLEQAFARRRAAGTDLLVADRMVREGRLGRSVGVGWYRYPGGGGAVIDPLMEDMIVEEAHFAGITPQPMPDSAAAELLICGIMNSGATVLADQGLDMRTLDRMVQVKLGLPDLTARARVMREGPLRQKLRVGQQIDPGLWTASPDLARLF